VFEKATDEAVWSEMYAWLGKKMMEQSQLLSSCEGGDGRCCCDEGS